MPLNTSADYLAFGAFFHLKQKKLNIRQQIKFWIKLKKFTNIPLVAIGGINSDNYKNHLLKKANFLAISGYIWNNKKIYL